MRFNIKKHKRNRSNQLAVSWPSLEEEVGDYKRLLKGKVLNAGSGVPIGNRDLSPLVDGILYNQDIFEHELIEITSPLHQIPMSNGFFDVIFCNAVLEHVQNPVEIVDEFFRVLKPTGQLYLAVPFMQPEHLCPTDYQRYTQDGLQELVKAAGFCVVKAEGVHNVYRTLGWVIEEWLTANSSLRNTILKALLFPLLRYLSKHSDEFVHSVASVYRVIAIKE